MNKRIILLVLVLCFSMIFAGCGKTPKTPENFDKDLWEDSVKVTNVIYDTIEKKNNFSVKDERIIEEYFETYKNRTYDNINENSVIKNISNVYKNYNKYLIGKKVGLFVEDDETELKQSLLELEKLYNELTK